VCDLVGGYSAKRGIPEPHHRMWCARCACEQLSAVLLVTGSLMCRFESLHCVHTFTAVSLLDPVAKLLKAGEQRGMALREEDGCLLRLSAAALQKTD